MIIKITKEKYIKQTESDYEVILPEFPTFYKKDIKNYIAMFPQKTHWNEENPHEIWKYEFIEVNDKTISHGCIMVSEFNNIISYPEPKYLSPIRKWFVEEILINEHKNADPIPEEYFIDQYNMVNDNLIKILHQKNN